jgi:hypothetical protein
MSYPASWAFAAASKIHCLWHRTESAGGDADPEATRNEIAQTIWDCFSHPERPHVESPPAVPRWMPTPEDVERMAQ